ncbi:membrane protein [Streptomyces daqingensis]|uniref:Membrane protein n=2 Tax=Streptomyces daqingensis TaxID=1472640 RepID=A0ABQ2MFI6_9ACTN|nr:membrane protein [Streptomyces daqingensis]
MLALSGEPGHKHARGPPFRSLAHGVMSQKDPSGHEGRRTATERLREERKRERAAERRGRNLKVGAVVVALLAVAGGVGAMLAQQSGGDAENDAKPITVGKRDAPAKLTVYEDFRCPACGQFEQRFRKTIHGLEKQGKLRAEYHLVTIIDDNMGGSGSHAAANAAVCARDEGRFRQYHDVLFQNQPEEQDDAFADEKTLVKLAGKAGGLNSSRFRDCVADGSHEDWVKKSSASFKKSGYQSTPTVLLDGENVYGDQSDPLTPESLKRKVEEKS